MVYVTSELSKPTGNFLFLNKDEIEQSRSQTVLLFIFLVLALLLQQANHCHSCIRLPIKCPKGGLRSGNLAQKNILTLAKARLKNLFCRISPLLSPLRYI
jgi:hypothetical protein